MSAVRQNRPEDIAITADAIKGKLETAIHTINDVYERTHVISINSRIEAARVGEKGKGFKIVAHEFSRLNQEISNIASSLEEEIREEILNLKSISEAMAKDVRGQRLSQIGISVMDVIDRNLYERSCDVRWWATDSSVVEVLQEKNVDRIDHASERLGLILDSYTVYLDLVVADMDGNIVANGRPGIYRNYGKNVAGSEWFRKAKQLRTGQEYALESTHRDFLVNNESVLTYSCLVLDPEKPTDPGLGVLGILFNWNSLVQAVFGRVVKQDLYEDINTYRIDTEIWIIDEKGIVLASQKDSDEGEPLKLTDTAAIINSRKQGHRITQKPNSTEIISWGYSPGFETYRSDWYCVIRQVLS